VRVRVEESSIILEGTNSKEMARYMRNNLEKTGDIEGIKNLLPWRKKTGWKQPTMKNKEILGKEKET
jgi:hypothetical protein